MTTTLPSTSVIHGFAKALPDRVVSNDDLSELMDTSDEWITQRTGIKTRHWVGQRTGTSDLAVAAANETLRQLGTRDIDAIIAATTTPDFCFPGIGVQIQDKLKLKKVAAYDVRNQCTGFLYGVEMADALIRTGQYQRILLVGAEVASTGLDITTRGRDMAVLFGDGAGSCVVERNDLERSSSSIAFEVLKTELHADGAFVEELWCEHPGSVRFPKRLDEELVREGGVFPSMNGKSVFENAVKRMCEVSVSALSKLDMSVDDVALLVAHQANLRINQLVGRQLGLSKEKVFNTIQKYGNTTAATIPIGMCDAIEEGKVQSNDIVLNAAFGSGFTWGASVLRTL